MDSFTALADPTRRRIIELIGREERAAGAIGEAFAISAPAISQHLKALREAGLVRVRVDGQRRIYSLEPAGFAAIDAWLTTVRGFWATHLDRLADELRTSDRENEE